MGGRFASADRRRAAAACIVLAAACSATSPPPLPPRRTDFPAAKGSDGAPSPAAGTIARAPDLPAAAEPPPRQERYLGWTLAADTVSLFYLFQSPLDARHAAPMLLLTPAIHAVHGELGSAGISLAMRAAMFGGLYLAGRLADEECRSSDDICFPLGSLLLAASLLSSVVTVDAIVLARRERPAEEWYRLPVLSASFDTGGRKLLTLTARF